MKTGQVHIMLGSPDDQRAWPPRNEQDHYIGVDRGAFYLLEEGYRMDLVLGDFDSISEQEKQQIKDHASEYLEVDPDKDDTDAELSLMHAMNYFESDKILVYGWSGGRLDHLMSILMIPLQPRFQDIASKIEFVNQTNSIKYYLPGLHKVDKEQNKTYCSVIGMTPVKHLSLGQGFKYQLDEVDYDYPAALISNEFVAETANLSFKSGVVAFVQSRD